MSFQDVNRLPERQRLYGMSTSCHVMRLEH
jgi:hypothetical protein